MACRRPLTGARFRKVDSTRKSLPSLRQDIQEGNAQTVTAEAPLGRAHGLGICGVQQSRDLISLHLPCRGTHAESTAIGIDPSSFATPILVKSAEYFSCRLQLTPRVRLPMSATLYFAIAHSEFDGYPQNMASLCKVYVGNKSSASRDIVQPL